MSVCFGIGCEALCRTGCCILRCWTWDAVPRWLLYSSVLNMIRYADTVTLPQFRTGRPSASVPCGWNFSRGCDIGLGCCGGGVILLRLRGSALLWQGLLFEPKASSAPATMVLADSRSLSSIRRRSPAQTDVTSPAYAHSTHRKRRPPQTRQPSFPHTSYIGNRNIEKNYLLTLLTVLPSRKALILSTVISMILCLEA